MKRALWTVLFFCVGMWLSSCGAASEPSPVAPSALPSPQPTVAIATPIATQLPVATTSARTRWPPDLKTFLPANARVIDVNEVDTDGDGVSELLVIDQENGVGRGLVIRREGDNGRAYALGGNSPAELFQESWTANTVRDINGDGKIEIMVEGVVRGTMTALNIFQWNGSAYASLLSMTGSEGIAIDDPQNSGVFDFTALQVLFQRSAIMRATHAEWKKTAYEVKSDVLFILGAPTTFNNPEEAALAYYIFLDKDDPAEMARLLTEPQKSKTPLNALTALSRSVDSVSVESLKLEDEKPDSATAVLSIRYVEHATQKEQTAQHVWRLKKENNQWRLAELKTGN